MKEAISRLQNDEDYYGEFGKQYLSNSDIDSLLNNPAMFKQSEETMPMVLGRYFHTKMLEPQKLDAFEIVQASSRNTNIYKEAAQGKLLPLQHEIDEIDVLINRMKGNMDLFDMIYAENNMFEVPAIKELHGTMWKGKADIVSDTHVIDLKTTGDIKKFKSSAWNYNYDSQAYLYQEFFGKPMVFVVGCKKTGRLGIFECSQEFIDRGKEKVLDAIIEWERFYGPNKTDDVNNYYSKITL